MTVNACRYVNSLDRECGRASTHGEHCAFHAVLHEFEDDCRDLTPDEIREQVRLTMEVLTR